MLYTTHTSCMAWLCVRFYLSQVWNGGNRKVFMLFMLTRFHFAPILRNFVFVKSKRATRKKRFKNNSLKLKMGLLENRLYGNGCFLNRLWNIRVITPIYPHHWSSLPTGPSRSCKYRSPSIPRHPWHPAAPPCDFRRSFPLWRAASWETWDEKDDLRGTSVQDHQRASGRVEGLRQETLVCLFFGLGWGGWCFFGKHFGRLLFY